MDIGNIAKVLRTHPLFGNVDQAKLKLIAFASIIETFDAGEIVFREGEKGDSAFLIMEGSAEIVVDQEAGGGAVIGTLGKDDMMGEMAIFRSSPRVATIRACEGLSMLRIEGEVFLDVVSSEPSAALGVMRALTDKIARATQAFDELDRQYGRLEADMGKDG